MANLPIVSVGVLVQFSTLPDATWFEVVAQNGFAIDVTEWGLGDNQRPMPSDVSLVKAVSTKEEHPLPEPTEKREPIAVPVPGKDVLVGDFLHLMGRTHEIESIGDNRVAKFKGEGDVALALGDDVTYYITPRVATKAPESAD